MKRLLYAALLISMGTYAEEASKIVEPAEGNSHKEWPSLDEWADKNDIKAGVLSAEVRLGYEHADLSGNGNKAANALLTRTRVTYEATNEEGFSGKIQGQYVGPLNDHYNPRDPNYDIVADPEAFRLHEVYLAYTGYDTHVRIGPQEIILDNARFIGNVDWRFNAQSFNAGLIKNDSIENLTLLYVYADSINATNGETDQQRQYHMFNGEYKLDDNNKISGFAYLQQNDGGTDINTLGARLWGKNGEFTHNAMLALQRDAYYGFLSGAINLDTVDLELGLEYISGGDSSRDQFRTLNGTAHAFNGWADQFLGTAAGLQAGLVDVWVKGSISPMENMKLIGVYHYFNTAANTPSTSFSGTYGNEVDAMLKYKVCKNFDALTGAAVYFKGDSNSPFEDKTVFWLRGTLSF